MQRVATAHTLQDLSLKCIGNQWQGSILSAVTGNQFSTDCIKEKKRDLFSHHRIEHGDRVVVVMDDEIDAIYHMLIIWLSGGVLIPIERSTFSNTESFNSICKDSNAKYYIWENNLIILESFNTPPSIFVFSSPRNIVDGSDLALIIYTSGSTGAPKGILLSHTNVICAINSISNYLDINSTEKIFSCLPLSFDYGLYQILFSLSLDCKLVIYKGAFNPLKISNLIYEHKTSLLPVVPSIISSLQKIWESRPEQMHSIEKITNTGGHLSSTVCESLRITKSNIKIYAMYGLTECKRALYLPPEYNRSKKDCVGIPIPGMEAKLFNHTPSSSTESEQYIEVSCGNIGELFVRGSTVMQGYCGVNPETGVRLITGGYREDIWLATGDLFSQDEDGFFYFKGRKKSLIKQGGYCLYSTEIEAKTLQSQLIQSCCVIGDTDNFGNEIATLYVNSDMDKKELKTELKKWLIENIDNNYIPKRWSLIDSLPLLENGKVDLKALQKTGEKSELF